MAPHSTAAVMKATIWFCVSDEQKTPIAAKAPPSSSSPMYEPATLPVSMLPTGSPRAYTLKYATSVGSSEMNTSVQAARNLAHTIVQSLSGRVMSISIVPPRRSSATERMETHSVKPVSTRNTPMVR